MNRIKTYISKLVRWVITPSLRFELREAIAWFKEQLDRSCVWRWENVKFIQQKGGPYVVHFIGRKKNLALVKILLGVKDVSDASQDEFDSPSHTVLVSEMPIIGALRVPKYLRAVVPLGKKVEEIMAQFDSELRRSLRKSRPLYAMKQALSDIEIEYADRELLRPYASARHGSNANQMPLESVRRFAKEFGRLDFVLKEGRVVACLLGYEYVCSGRRYWMLDRFGYPESVFSDAKLLGETNSMNNHLEMEWAVENGYDYYDIALVFARPDDGLFKWKKRRGAIPFTIGLRGYSPFYIRLPSIGQAQFLWDTPLFAFELKKLTLHIGIPDGLSDEEISKRYREMGFGGLFKVYLHCVNKPSNHLLERLRNLYSHQNSPPIIRIILST